VLAAVAAPGYPADPAVFPVYHAKDLIEAELLLQRMQDRGIPAAVQNGFLLGLLGELPLSVRPTVCVLEERDVTAAQLCIREMVAALQAPELPDRVCPSCGDTSPGNFEECWKCRCELT
jgi:putative signal transducing protein